MSDPAEAWRTRLERAGALSPDGEPLVPSSVMELLAGLHGHVEDLKEKLRVEQDALTSSHVRARSLVSQQNRRVSSDPLYPQVLEVLEHWSEVCWPEARELESPKRTAPVLARLRGKPKPWSVEELKRSADGYAAFPYVIDGKRLPQGPPARRYVDAELIYRDAKHVAQGLAYADEADHRAQVMPEILTPEDGVRLSELGQAALTMASYGFYVFPVAPRNKFPVTPHGLKDAKRDPDAIMKCWRDYPDLNVAVRCGKESEIFVLDVDGDDGFESLRTLEKKHGELPVTLSVKTPRGGQHFYFRHPAVDIHNTEGFPGYGLDVRGDGGYVLAPPSIGPNGNRYEVDERVPIANPPAWLVNMLCEYQVSQEKVDVAEYAKLFEGLPQGQRNSKMTQYVGRLWHKHTPPEVLGIALAINHDYCRPPLPDRDIKKIVDSIARREERKTKNTIRLNLEGAA